MYVCHLVNMSLAIMSFFNPMRSYGHASEPRGVLIGYHGYNHPMGIEYPPMGIEYPMGNFCKGWVRNQNIGYGVQVERRSCTPK